MPHLLGIDGGGTRCRAAVADGAGAVLGEAVAGPANVWTDAEAARDSILDATRSALAQAGLATEPRDLVAVLGLAGANLPAAAARIAGLLPFARMRIETDALIALRGALGPGDGLAAMLGTGSVFGRQRAGRIDIVGGWGFQLGDQGSGARLGKALLERALLAHDGLAPPSPLLAEVISEAGGPAELVIAMRDAGPARFAEYVPRLVAAAEGGDAGAGAILDAASRDVAGFLAALDPEGRLPVCFVGGLGETYAARLAPGLGPRLVAVAGTPLDGALALARDLAATL